MQDSLFEFKSPLDLKVGRAFFTDLPKTPGVYRMFGDDGDLLYVGKSVNLKSRLMSYRHVDLDSSSRKTLRLVHQVARIEYETCENEQGALIRENELLRTLKPPFNVVNTRPETYFYFKVRIQTENLSQQDLMAVTLSLEPDSVCDDGAAFGAFKNLGRCQRTFFALRRILWLMHEYDHESPFAYPQHLMKRQRLSPHTVNLSKEWLNHLAGLFHGFSLNPIEKEPSVVKAVRERLQRIQNCDLFYRSFIEQDLAEILQFYRSGSAFNSKIKHFSKTDSPTIDQHLVDDLITFKRFQTPHLSPHTYYTI